jgi:hypothetical protein
LRIDQVITCCLKYCVPIAAVAFLGATWWQYQWPDRAFFGMWPESPASYQLRENWPESTTAGADKSQTDHTARSTVAAEQEST